MPDLSEAVPLLGRGAHPLLTARRITLVGVSAILYEDHATCIATCLARPRSQSRRGGLFGLLSVARPVLERFFSPAGWASQEARAHPGLPFDLAQDLPPGCVLRQSCPPASVRPWYTTG